jgi:hypothetical protein
LLQYGRIRSRHFLLTRRHFAGSNSLQQQTAGCIARHRRRTGFPASHQKTPLPQIQTTLCCLTTMTVQTPRFQQRPHLPLK